MKIVRNGILHMEELTVTVDNRAYRVTGSPDVASDKHAMVEVFRAETMHGHKKWTTRVRFGHWARISSANRRAEIREAALAKQAADLARVNEAKYRGAFLHD